MSEVENSQFLMSTERIESLSDGVFAFAMTLLVINLSFPDATIALKANLAELLLGQWHKFFNYAVSFILLALLWLNHHQQFHFIQRANPKLLWVNIFLLLFVALMPFSSDLIGDFSGDTVAEIFFGCNLFILGSLLTLNWLFAIKDNLFIDAKLDSAVLNTGIIRSLVTPIISLVAIFLAFFIQQWSLFVYILIPLMLVSKPFKLK